MIFATTFVLYGVFGPMSQSTRPDSLIADFEQPTYGTWKTTGRAFGDGPANGSLSSQMKVSGFLGNGLVNSYHGGDGSIGSLKSPKFKIERKAINFLIGGGYQPTSAYISLIVGGKVIRSTTGLSKTPQDTEALTWATWDVEKLQGQTAQIQIVDAASGGWGHINVDEITQSDNAKATPGGIMSEPQKPYEAPSPEPVYRERYRPQFHFSAKKNWLNDPNGLVYFEGQYHLFFQHNPFENVWGNMTWGHAISTDLVHWKEQAPAIKPDDLGTIFSGSAALDVHNTTGFGKDGQPPLVAMYTAAGKPFTQCLVYSTDKGKTWQKYESNPVLKHVVNENRDPRIFYHEPTKQWIMVLYLDGDEFAIYGSPDLKSFKELSRLHLPDSSECPDLFEIPVQGSTEKKWVFFGANYRYLIGSFDGVSFTKEVGPIHGDLGNNFYASQTYNNTPDGRRIQIAWMIGQGPLPNMPFNQQMSFPCELKLVKTNEGLRLLRYPVKEIEKLRARKVWSTETTVASGVVLPVDVKGGVYDLNLSYRPDSDSKLTVHVGKVDVVIDSAAKTISCLGKQASFQLQDGQVELRVLVDRSSIEVFAQHGAVSMTSYLPVPFDNSDLSLLSENGASKIEKMEAYELKSAW